MRSIYDYSKLRGLIREKFGTIANFADCVGISTTTLSKKLNNITTFTQPEIEKSIKLLDIPKNEVTNIFFKK